MTVLTRPDSPGDPALVVICDRCGQAVRTSDVTMSDFPILWQILQQTGWTGPHRPVGPHFCPACVGGVRSGPATVDQLD
jgi:hypothetical protein